MDNTEDMVEITTTISDLFWAISVVEGHEFIPEKEHTVNTPIYLQNELNDWCLVPAMITKNDFVQQLEWNSGDVTRCASKHWIRTSGDNCILAQDIMPGDTITNSHQEVITCISNTNLGVVDTVYDLQINTDSHLYQTADKIVHHNTLMVSTLSKILNVPFATVDATSLSQTGYVGLDPEECLTRLFQAAENDLDRAQKGIIFIDEIDKIGRKSGENVSTTRDVSGEGVQQALLKIIEGNDVKFTAAGGRKNPNGEFVTMNTRNILFILGGAFEGLAKHIAARSVTRDNSMGFLSSITDPDVAPKDFELVQQVTVEDLISFGMIPELVGRIPVIVPFEDLDEATLVRIMVEPKNAIVRQFEKLFQSEGIELKFEPDALMAVAKQVLNTRTGARGLRRVIEGALMNTQFLIHKHKKDGVHLVKVTQDTIEKSQEPELVREEMTV